MPDIADVTVKLRADMGDVLAQLGKLDQAVKDAGRSAGELTGGVQKLGQGLDALKSGASQASQGMAQLSESARRVVDQQNALEQSAREAASTVEELRSAYQRGETSALAVARAEGELRDALTRANSGMTEAQQAAKNLEEQQRQLEAANRAAMQSWLDGGNAASTAGGHYQQLSQHLTDISNKAKQLGGDLTALGMTLSLGVTAPIVGVGVAALKTAGELEQNSIAFKTMLGSAAAAQEHLERLKAFALTTPFQFTDLVLASKRMQALGFEAKEVIPSLTAIGDAAAALGMGAEGINRVVIALGQMKAKGMVQAEEMRQLAEAGIPAWQILAKTLNTDVAGAMKMVEQRTVEAATAVPALLAGMNEKFGGLMAAQSKTLLGQWSNFKDALTFTLTDIGNSIAPVFKSLMESAIMPLLDVVKSLARGFAELPAPLQQFTVGILGLAAAIGPVTLVAGKLIEGFGQLTGVMAKLLPAFVEVGSAAGGITGSMGLLEAAVTTTGLSIGGLALAVGGLVAGAAIAWSELQQGLAPLHSLDESFNTWLGSTKELDKILAQLSVSMREATTAIEAGVNPSKELADAWGQVAKAGQELEKQRQAVTKAHNEGWITDDTAAQKFMALRDASDKLKESQNKLIGLDWKSYTSEMGLVVEVTDGLSEASKKLVTEQRNAEAELKKAEKVYEELKAAQDGSVTMAKALERAHQDVIAAQKKVNAEVKEGTSTLKEYGNELAKATRKFEDVNPVIVMVVEDMKKAEAQHRAWIKAIADTSRELGRLATDQEVVDALNRKVAESIQAIVDKMPKAVDATKELRKEWKDAFSEIEKLAQVGPKFDPLEEAIEKLKKNFVDVKGNVDLAFAALERFLKSPSTSPGQLQEAFENVSRAIRQLAQTDLPAAIQKQQEYIDKLKATGASVTLLAEAYRMQDAMIRANLEDQIYAAERQGKSADEAYIKLVNFEQKLKDLHDSTNLLGKAWETVVQAWNHGWENMADAIVDSIEGAKSWGDAWKSVLKEIQHEILTGLVKTAMGALRPTLDDLFRKIGGGGGGVNIGGINIPLPGTTSTGPKGPIGTSVDPIYVIVKNMGAAASGGSGGGGSSLLAGLAGLGAGLGLGQLSSAASAGFPGAAGAGGGMALPSAFGALGTLGIAAAFGIPLYMMGTSLFGDKGAWYNDPAAFAQSMFAQSGGQFQMSDPETQRRAQGMFGLPADAEYWKKAVEAFKSLTDQLLGEHGLLMAKPPENPVTATAEERQAAVQMLKDSIEALKLQQTDLQDRIVIAIKENNLPLAANLDAQLTTVNQNLKTQEDLLDRIQGNTGDTVDAMSGVVASAEQQAEALKQAQEAVNALKAQEQDLQNQIIVAIANGDMETATKLAGELGKVDGKLQTANGFLELIKAATSLTADQQKLIVQATAKAFAPEALAPLIEKIDSLKIEQADLQNQLAEAVRNGDTKLAEELAKRLDTVNGNLEAAQGEFRDMNSAIQAQTGQSEEVVAATKAMEEALKTGDIKAITAAADKLKAAMDEQPDKIAKAESDLMAAIMSGNTQEILTALGALETAMADAAKEDTARQTSLKLDALKGIAASAQDQADALQRAKDAVDALKGQQQELLQALIIATASGDQDLVRAIEEQLGIIDKDLGTAQSFYDRLEAMIPSQVDRIVGTLGDIASNLANVAAQFASSLNLPAKWDASSLSKWNIPTEPGEIQGQMEATKAMISHFEELVGLDQGALDVALANNDANAEKLRAQLAADTASLKDLRTLLGLLTIALGATGQLKPEQLAEAIASAETQVKDLTAYQTFLNRMLVLATDPTQRAIIQGQLAGVATDLRNANELLAALKATNLDGTTKIVDAVKDSSKTTGAGSGSSPGSGGAGAGAGGKSDNQKVIDDLNAQIGDLSQQMQQAQQAGNLDLAYQISLKLQPLVFALHDATNAQLNATIQQEAFRSAYGNPVTVADFDKIIAGIKGQLDYAVEHGNKPLIDQLNAQLRSLEAQRAAAVAAEKSAGDTAKNTGDAAKHTGDSARSGSQTVANTSATTAAVGNLNSALSIKQDELKRAVQAGDLAQAAKIQSQIDTLTQVRDAVSSQGERMATALGRIPEDIAIAIQAGVGSLADALLAIAAAIANIQPSVTNNYYSTTQNTVLSSANTSPAAAANSGTSSEQNQDNSSVGHGGGSSGRGFALGGMVPYDMQALVHKGELILPPNLSASILSVARRSGSTYSSAGEWSLSPEEMSAATDVGGSIPRSFSPALAQQISQDASSHQNLTLGPIYIQGTHKNARQLAEEIYQELPRVAKLRTPRAAHRSQ